jgi:hypothetical protein
MKEELEKLLVKTYPCLYRDYGGDMRQTCMHWGFACGDGWFDIINDLSRKINVLMITDNVYVVADQVKEKFGGLRFYCHIECENPSCYSKISKWCQTFMFNRKLGRQYWKIINFRRKFWKSTKEKISDIIDEAESLSFKTCEICGNPGELRGGNWMSTLCNNCHKNK